MTVSPPSWADADWATRIGEPFRSDGRFWAGLAASTDALLSLVAAVIAAISLGAAGERAWSIVPFVVPAALIARAVAVSASSSRRSRAAFADTRTWRDAERAAVATAFVHVLRRPRFGPRRAA
jgi:hypothetical protein